ncbi:MAG: hypothetical protein WCI73_04615, partial [Phycisphaerae bacterium]
SSTRPGSSFSATPVPSGRRWPKSITTDLIIAPNGVMTCIYTEALALDAFGAPRITRASHVEPDHAGSWWADLAPLDGPVLGPFGHRSDALRAEQDWLGTHLPAIAGTHGSPSSRTPNQEP